MCVGECYDDNFFAAHGVDHDVWKAFDDALPEIGVDGFPSKREAFDALYAGLELFCQAFAQFRIDGFVVLRCFYGLNIYS